jgi:hypothetical protein
VRLANSFHTQDSICEHIYEGKGTSASLLAGLEKKKNGVLALARVEKTTPLGI